jgi:hypothetical protein
MFGVAAVKSLMTWILKHGRGFLIVAGHFPRLIFNLFMLGLEPFVVSHPMLLTKDGKVLSWPISLSMAIG